MAAVCLHQIFDVDSRLTFHSKTPTSRARTPKPTFQTAHLVDQSLELHLSCLTKVAWYKLLAQEFCVLQMSEVGHTI